jgi:adenosylmethionine-8-amino-7-oxononanoate aminotransferase
MPDDGIRSAYHHRTGPHCRADDRGDLQLAPPLICGPAEFDEMEQILRSVLTEAWARL